MLTDTVSLERELDDFRRSMPNRQLQGRSRTLITFTPEMFDMIDDIQVAARHNVTALLVGETGCGKTFLAHLIHELSERRDEKFCNVACGALPPDLIESELFGYVKGAFTGADRDKPGKFAAAGCGTLLLDEIDVLPVEQQAKLLRVIETGEYEPVGSNETQKSAARVIVASNFDLAHLVQNGTFRTDLYYRLNVLTFRLFPLRERPRDIEYLARKFAGDHSSTHGITLHAIDPGFLDAMWNYSWPGNVREIENVVRRAVLYCRNGVLTARDLPDTVRTGSRAIAANDVDIFRSPVPSNRPEVTRSPLPNPTYAPAIPRDPPPQRIDPSNQPRSLEDHIERLEQQIIEDSLRRHNHRRKETAAELGISRVTLYNKMKKFGLI